MDIGLARDRGGVAEAVGDMLEHRLQRRRLGRVVKEGKSLDACRPGAEMLGAELVAHRLADIGVHIVRSDRAQAVGVLILEKLLPRQILQSAHQRRSEEHTSELQSLMRISYAVFCLKKKNKTKHKPKKQHRKTTQSKNTTNTIH